MRSKSVGTQLGSLKVIDAEPRRTASGAGIKTYVLVSCACGSQPYWASLSQLKGTKHPMCGRCRREAGARVSAMGHKHPLFKVWEGMINRCYRPSTLGYAHYGGRGIEVCPRWLGEDRGHKHRSISGFHAFIQDMGARPDGGTLERLDVNGNYEPDNCVWASWEEQANNRRHNTRVPLEGVVKTVSQWDRHFGVHWAGAAAKYGVPLEVAIQLVAAAHPQRRWDWAALFADVATKRPVPPPRPTHPVGVVDEAFDKFLETLVYD